MIKTNPRLLHPQFDLDAARRAFKDRAVDPDDVEEHITSPYDMFAIEEMRARGVGCVGRAVPTDVFIMGKGEPARRDMTKVGGLPYWPVDRPWPRNGDDPLRFLAQFNFADSTDLVGELPGAVLAVFVEAGDDFFWKPPHFEWLPPGLDPVRTIEPDRVASNPFFGCIHRTVDYFFCPESEDPNEWGPDVFRPMVLQAIKIGGVGSSVQGEDPPPGRFLCQLNSIQAACEVPYPWANSPDSLDLGFTTPGIYHESNKMMLGDMGVLAIYMDDDGTLRSTDECY
ncbi:MAG: hypothetical protein AMXMBFR47_05810 [Planctomycetota bacterium]